MHTLETEFEEEKCEIPAYRLIKTDGVRRVYNDND